MINAEMLLFLNFTRLSMTFGENMDTYLECHLSQINMEKNRRSCYQILFRYDSDPMITVFPKHSCKCAVDPLITCEIALNVL